MKVRHLTALLVSWYCFVLCWRESSGSITGGDLGLYERYAKALLAGKIPYRDFSLEYPPLSLLAMVAPKLSLSDLSYASLFAGIMLLVMVVLQWVVVQSVGAEKANLAAWLCVLLPVAFGLLARERFDLLPAFIFCVGVLFVLKDRFLLAAVLFTVGGAIKLFPFLAMPPLIVWLWAQQRKRLAVQVAGISLLLLVLFFLPFASSDLLHMFRYHLDRPIEIEATPAIVLLVLGGSRQTTMAERMLYKSQGILEGHAGLVGLMFTLLLVCTLISLFVLPLWLQTKRDLVRVFFAAVLAFVVLGKVLSPQFLIWIAPLAIVLFCWGQRLIGGLCLVAALMTRLEYPHLYRRGLFDGDPLIVTYIAVRNGLLLIALILMIQLLVKRARSSALAVVAAGS